MFLENPGRPLREHVSGVTAFPVEVARLTLAAKTPALSTCQGLTDDGELPPTLGDPFASIVNEVARGNDEAKHETTPSLDVACSRKKLGWSLGESNP